MKLEDEIGALVYRASDAWVRAPLVICMPGVAQPIGSADMVSVAGEALRRFPAIGCTVRRTDGTPVSAGVTAATVFGLRRSGGAGPLLVRCRPNDANLGPESEIELRADLLEVVRA